MAKQRICSGFPALSGIDRQLLSLLQSLSESLDPMSTNAPHTADVRSDSNGLAHLRQPA
mgnify:CR=1 FL=1